MSVIKNLTPHSINILDADNNIITTFPSEGVARCNKNSVKVSEWYGIPINTVKYSETTGLPDPDLNSIYIVSLIVAQANPQRDDLLVVDDVVRSTDGSTVLGCRAFSQLNFSQITLLLSRVILIFYIMNIQFSMRSNPNGYDYLQYQSSRFSGRTITQTNGWFEIDCNFEYPEFEHSFVPMVIQYEPTVA